MNLGELRTKFKEFSGRYDLDDAGVDFFINAGARLLQSRAESVRSVLRYQSDLSAGDYYIDVPGLVAVNSAWITDADGRKKLTPLGIDEVREKFGEDYDQLSRSSPSYYSYAIKDFGGDQWNVPPTPTYDDSDIVNVSGYDGKTRVLLLPPADGVYTVTLFGKFVPQEMQTATDTNYWSEQYPDVLLIAALYKLEVFYRNREGAADWANALQEALIGIASDFIEYTVGERTVMEG